MTNATYVLIHGAGDSAWYWHLVDGELRQRGHEVVVMDLPVDDDSSGLSERARSSPAPRACSSRNA